MKEVKIKIQFGKQETLKLTIRHGLFRKVSLEVNDKFEGFYSFTKIINRIKNKIQKYLKG
jgi:hypothetical protein